jgi:hypothetical protein
MGGMFAVGLVGARLLKGAMSDDESQSESNRSSTGSSFGQGQGSGSGESWFADAGSGGVTASGGMSSPSGTTIFDDIPAEPRTGSMTGGSISGGVSSTGAGGLGSSS